MFPVEPINVFSLTVAMATFQKLGSLKYLVLLSNMTAPVFIMVDASWLLITIAVLLDYVEKILLCG